MAEHIFDLVDFLDRRVTLPAPRIPQILPTTGTREEVERIATEVRTFCQVPTGPLANVVRLLEVHGAVVARLDSGGTKLDAFSRWFGDRPLVLLWADKSDKARSRFDAAHERGHLVMHTDPDPLDREQERQANMFASAFLMPADQISRYLQRRAPTARDWPTVLAHRKHWGVSAKALLYRSKELGALNESGFRRSMIGYNQRGLQSGDGAELGAAETPLLLARAIAALGSSVDDVARQALVPMDLVEAVATPAG